MSADGNEDEKPAAPDADVEAEAAAAELDDAGEADAEAAGAAVAAAADADPEPLVVQCPQCAVPADPESLCCPSCHEDLVALVRLRYAGRIAFNEALGLLRAGRREAAVVALERAVAAEPGLGAAKELLARLADGPDTTADATALDARSAPDASAVAASASASAG